MVTTTLPASSPSLPALQRLVSHREAIFRAGSIRGASGRNFPIFPTGMTAAAGEFLRDLIVAEEARATLETGLAFGLSTLYILEGLLRVQSDLSPDTHLPFSHTAIDPYQSTSWDRAALASIEHTGLGSPRLGWSTPPGDDCPVRVIEEDSALALPRLIGTPQRFDVAFVDGGHHFENAFLDVCYLTRLVRPGGLIIIDDAWMPAIRAAADYFSSNMGLIHLPTPTGSAGSRFIVLRQPVASVARSWDHFVPFWNSSHAPAGQR